MERRAPLVLAWILFLLGTLVGQDDVFRTKGRVAPAAIQDPTRSSVAPAKNRPSASSAQKTQALANYSRLPLSFEPNHGQAGSAVKYLARGGQFNVFLTQDELAFGFARRHSHRRSVFDMEDSAAQDPPEFSSLELRLVGANPSSPVWGEEQLGGTANYLVGRDPSQWHVNLPTFAKIRYRNVYRGVDLLYYGNQGELESDFIIAPGANPEAVTLSVVGAEAITIAASGDLVLRMKDGELRLRKPLVYQTVGTSRKEIAGGYVLAGNNQVSFRVARYDHKQPLIIDPVLSYSTYLGGNGSDEATAIAVDSAGNAYITGDASSTNFPTTLGPATGDMFVAKLDPNGVKVYATYVGGTSLGDFPTGIGVDALSNAYVAGQTSETNLPTTTGALRTTYQGGAFDGFVFSLNSTGTGFNYFTYLGGSAFDLLSAVAVDSLGNAYITGQTSSGDYPTASPFETLAAAGDGGIFTTTNSGTNWSASATGLVNRNITVVAVDPHATTNIYAGTSESGVIASTNSGTSWSAVNTGLTNLVINALAVDPATANKVYVGTGGGGVFVTTNGGTSWATLNTGLVGRNVHALASDPASSGTLYASTGQNGVSKFSAVTGSWSATGALPQDIATAIVVDPTNNQNVYASFQNSGVYRSSNGGTSWAAFTTGLSSLQVAALAIDHGGHLYAGTRTGGVFLSTGGGSWSTIDTGLPFSVFQALATDPTNNTTVYVGTFNGGVFRSTNNGASWSQAANDGLNNTRVTALAVDPGTPTNLNAGSQAVEAVVTKLSPSGGLVFSSYLGGGGGESGLGIAIDGDNGNLYVAGFTNSLNFPTVAPAQATMNGGISGFVSKVKSDGSGLTYSTYLGGSGNSDQAFAIAADSAGNAYVTGVTNSTDFPTVNATQTTLAGTNDAFVAKYNASGQKLFATYLGGEATEAGNAITVTANTDGSTSAWVAGQTTSQFFPLANPIQLEHGDQGDGSNAGFISDFNFPASGAAPTLVFSTYLGTGCGTGCDTVAQAIGHDGTNNIYVAGRTMSNSFPAVNAAQSTLAGPQNAFIAKIGATTNNADLSLTLNSFGPTTVVAGALVTFSLTVTNHGPNDAANVALGGRGGANLNLVTCTVTQGVCGNNLQVLDRGFAELGTLTSGASATVTGTLQPLSACGVAGALACPYVIDLDVRSDANDPNPSNNSATTNLTVLPGADLAVTLSASPSPSPVQVGGTLNYIANVANLGPSNASNVIAVFSLAPTTAATFVLPLPTGCTNINPGTLTCIIGPTPAGTAGPGSIPVTVNSLPITAAVVVSNTPEADPDPTNNSASVTTTLSVSGVNNAELNGQYAFLLRGFDPSGHAIAIGGSFTADGAGHITGGVMDVNQNSGVTAGASITAASSSYSVGADNRGQLTLTTAAGTETFDFSVGSISSGVASLGHIISRRSASATNGSAISGVFKKQDTTAFTLTALNGDWAFLNEGVDGSGGRFANAGRFTLSGGNLTLGSEDFNDNGVFDNGTTTASTLTGSFGSLDTTNGRAPLTTTGSGSNPTHDAVYIVSASEALFMSIDAISANPLAGGSALRQATTFCPTTGGCNFTNSALSGNAVVYVQGNSSSGVAGASDVNVGVLTFTLATTSYSGGFDENDGGTIYCPAGNICANPGGSIASGNYSVASNGRVTLTETGEGHAPFFYMVNTNQAFLIGTSSSHVETGMAENQAGPITPGSFGSAFGTEPPAVSGSLMFSGVQTAIATGNTTAILTGTTSDVNSFGPIPDTTSGGLHEDVSLEDDTLTVDPTTGRFTFASGTKVGYFINSNRSVTINVETANAAPYIIISDNQSSSIGAKPDLSVGITANPSTGVDAGGFITYQMTVANALSTPATGVVLATAFSPSLTVNSVTPSQGSCAVGASPVASFTCSLGTVNQGTPVTVTIVAVAPASGTACGSSALGCIIVGADVTENEIDFNPADNTATAITPILQAGATSCTGTTTNWLGGTGNWSDATKWSTGAVPNSTSVNVCIDNGNPVASQVTLDISASVANLTIDSNDSLIISNNTTLVVAGNIANSGQISVSAAGNTTVLQIAGGHNASLSGGGTLTLSTSGNGTPVINETSGGATLTNVDNTIQGQGQIGNNGLALVNQASGTINANVAAPLLINSSGITNAGLLEASGGGTLQTNTTVNNTGGTLAASGSSTVQLLNGTSIQGGTLNASGGAILGAASGQTITLDGTTHGALINAGTYTGVNSSATILRGAINNTGAIQIAAVGNPTFLEVAGGQNTSLAGGGTVTLSKAGNGTAIINQTSGGATLTNVDNTIQGQGEIGNNGLVLVNQAAGTINANVAGTLTVDAPSITNQHVMEATSGGTLALSTTTVNNNASTILANGGTVQFTNTTIQGGTLNTLNNGVLGTAPGQTATLDGVSTHQGTLSNIGTYTAPNGSATILQGTINNTGTILLAATGNPTELQVLGGQTTSLTGGGTVTMSTTGNGTPVINETSGGGILSNADNTIQGQGDIGNNGLALVNSGTIDANLLGKTLTIDAASPTNSGTLEATAGGILALSASTINNKSGIIKADAAGSTVQFVNNVTLQSGTLSATNGAVLGTAASAVATLDGSTLGQPITLSGAYTAANNSSTILVGTINDTGAFLLNATGNNTLLQVRGGQTVTLTGGGTVTMATSGNGTPIINQTSGAGGLTNVNNTIQGRGEIGNNGLTLVNQAIINANVPGGTLTVDALTPTNTGILEATSGGALALNTSVLNNQGGTITVDGASSAVQFVNNATIQGGTLATTNGGLLGAAASNTITLDGSTHGALANTGTFVGANNSATILLGTINNTGAFQLSATGNTTELQVLGGQNLTLTGGGTVTMSSSGNGTPVINQTSGGATLTNVNNLIQGQGQIGNNGMALVNQAGGTINANAAGPLLINASTVTNQHLLEATGGGTLQINTTVSSPGGTIAAAGTGSAVQFLGGTTLQGGTLSTSGGAVLGTVASNTITLDGSTTSGPVNNIGTYTGANNSATILKGTINNTGAVQIAATGNATALQILGGQNTTLTGSGTVTMSTSGNGTPVINQTSGGATLTNAGNTIQGQGQIGNNGLALVNQGTILANAANPLVVNPGGTLTNSGTMQANSGSTLNVSTATTSTGNVVVSSGGTIALAAGLTQTAGGTRVDGALTGSAVNINAGTLFGNGGTITAPASLTGALSPGDTASTAGLLTIAGTYSQAASGAYNVDIGGLQPGSQFDQLNVSGAVSLSGTLNVNLINGFSPAVGNSFTIMTAGSLSGTFATVNLPTLSSGSWQVTYNAASVVLTVSTLSAPGTLYSTGFENPPFTLGNLSGQDGWQVSGAAPVLVENTLVQSGSQAVSVGGSAGGQSGPYHSDSSTGPLIELSAGIYIASSSSQTEWQFAGLGPGLAPFLGGVNILGTGQIQAITAGLPTVGTWTYNAWNNLDFLFNITTQTYTITLNGVPLASGVPFCGDNGPCAGAHVSSYGTSLFDTFGGGNDTGYIDNFSVSSPALTITSLSPSSALAGGAAFTLTVNGAGFVNGSTVNFNGNARTTTFVNATQLTAAILASDIATAGNANVTVTNPAPGGGTSAPAVFVVSAANPVPTISTISPTSATAGGAAFTLTVNGTGFVSGSAVDFNGSGRTTTFVSATQLTAAILASDITTTGTFNIIVVSPGPGGGTSNIVTFTVGAVGTAADLAVAMTASPAPAPVLGSVTYQITVTNNGPNPATGVVLTDTLPAGTVFASIDDLTDCRVSNGTLTCNFSALGVGSAQTVNLILVPLAVPSGAGTFDNTVSVVANETDPSLSNNSATQTVQVTGTTLPGGGAFRNLPGFSTNILPGNDDNSTGSVPMNLTLNFFGVQVSSVFVNNNGNVTFDSALGTFTPFDLTSTGQQIIAPYFSDVETDFPTSGKVTYGNDTVNGRPAFGVNWPNVEYCCSSDPSKLNLFQVVLVDRSDVGSGNFDIEFNYDKIQWETGDASNGVGGLGGFSARAGYSNGSQTAGSFFELPGSGVPGSFLDTNTTAGLIYNDLNSTQPGRYVFQVRGGTVQSSADLAISANGPPSAATGSTITYTLTATNLGPNTATGVTVTDTLPAGFTFVSVTPSNICSPAGQPVVVTCNVGSLANGSNAVITIQAGIPTTASGTATDTAVVSVPNNQDLNLGNNTATAVTNITVLAPDLIISKTHTGNFVQGQTGATYTITVTNSGTGATTAAVTVNDILPAGLTATAISGTGWTCTSLTSCNRVDTLPAGASYPPITLTVDVAANAPSQVTNTATVSGGGEVNTANDTANDLTNIGVAAADLAVTVAVIPPADASGTTVSYAVTITNNGPAAATSVTLTDQLVGNASFASANSSTMTCPAPSASSLACTQAVLDNGASAVVNITVNLTGAGWDGNTVHATSPVPDPNPINNAAPVQKQLAGGNTGTGSDVAVQPVDSTSGSSPAVLTFASVTRGGTTALASAASGPAPPAGLRTGTPAVFYNLTTTAGYAGTISVALGFNGVSFHHPANVRLFHYENGAWVDRTVAVNPAGTYAVAQVTSLSPFALFEPINHVPDAKAGPDLTTAATSAQGAKVTLNGSASLDADHDPLTYRWTGPFPEGNGVVTGVNPTVTMPAGVDHVTLVVNDSEADSAPATQSITVTNFSMAAAAAGPTTISAGGSVSFHISASPQFGPFPAAVSLACLGLPQGAQCNFSTATVNAGGPAATLTISTTPRTAALAPVRHRNPAPLYTLWMPLPAIALMGLGLRRRSRKRAAALMLLLLLGMMLLLVSCGGGSIGVTPQPQNGTPAGTFTVTVTGTASGSLQHTTTVTFTVQ